ncbi:MAG: helix-turn-helix transcriptional regulator [Treponema sp.]|jgi:transcriptional regulator with XRE-family HTH domain|nr:helix-turn-helix transcriptional regulator [Treponema sp.]
MDKTEVRAALAGNIKAFRGRRNWSQADLAEKSKLSIVYLSDIERGNKWSYLDTLVKIAKALNDDDTPQESMKTAWFIGGVVRKLRIKNSSDRQKSVTY